MGKFVAVHLLKQYNPGTFNRGENGEAKQIIIGGVNRVRFSSQCQKRAIRELMACDEIRSAHIEKLISNCLDVYVENGTITAEEKELIGNAICSKEVIGSPCWKNVSKNKEETTKDLQGNVVVTTNASEIKALIDAFIEYLKKNGASELEKNKKTIAQTAALSDVSVSVAKALFGSMATDGVLGTVDGALEMGQAFSVDEYLPESDFFTVKFTGRTSMEASDPFFGAYESFNETESAKKNGETINNGLSLYSNLMYSYANINLVELERNLNTYVGTKTYVPNENTKDVILDVVPKFVKSMIEMTPEATQNRSSSHVVPTVVLVEVIEDGANLQPDWSRIIRNGETSIAEKAITKLGTFASDKTFRSGKITQYIMINPEYADMVDKFEGAIRIKSFDDLNDKLTETIKPLL